jgi:hypothetical protein
VYVFSYTSVGFGSHVLIAFTFFCVLCDIGNVTIIVPPTEDFVDFALLGQQPVTQQQTIAKAYVIINKTSRFKQAITEWNRLPDIQKTWINFKAFFRQAHQEFRETTDVTLEESELHRNNANIVQQVVDGLQGALTPVDTTPNESVALMQQMANAAAQSNETQQQLTAQIAQMQQAMALLQTQVQQQPYIPPPYNPPFHQRGGGRYNNGYQGRGAHGHHCGGRGSPYRQRNTAIYCWTHGGCGHTEAACTNQLPGHQPRPHSKTSSVAIRTTVHTPDDVGRKLFRTIVIT